MASVFRIADRIAMLHEHKILATGTVAEIQESREPYLYEFIRTSGVAAAFGREGMDPVGGGVAP
jgi:ABC-type transporter Mla maintaining outer membrane lipid asymmetry ATPase subunit MlaF